MITKEELREKIIQSCLRIAKQGGGALILIGGKPNYVPLVNQKRVPFSVDDELFELYAKEDGAMIVNEKGMVEAYRVRVLDEGVVIENHGTRHSSGASASLNGAYVILASQEDRKVKVYQNGVEILRYDALEKDIEKKVGKSFNILEFIGAGTIGTSVLIATAPFIGISPANLSGVTIFVSSGLGYVFLTKLKEMFGK